MILRNFQKKITIALSSIFLSNCASTGKSVGDVNSESKAFDHSNFTFVEKNGEKIKADWHPVSIKTQSISPTPACIVVHGGGWYKGDKKEMTSVATRLNEQGIAALNINYRLSPKYKFPESIYDVKDAIRWLKGNAKTLNIDTNKICMFGYSAGAHLSLMAGFTTAKDGFDFISPETKIFEYGSTVKVIDQLPTDLGVNDIVGGGTPSDLTSGEYNQYYEKYFGKPYAEMSDTYKKASPVFYARSGIPPLFLYHGRADWIVDIKQTERLVKKIKDFGGDVEFMELVFGHVATFLFDSKEVEASINFIKKHFNTKRFVRR